MVILKVINEGKKAVYRLGHRFDPKEEKEIQVTKKQVLTIKAHRDLKVQIVDEKKEVPEFSGTSEEMKLEVGGEVLPMEEKAFDPIEFVTSSTVNEVMEKVEGGGLSAEKALEIEKENQGRSSLISKLEAVLEGSQEEQGE
ncbi:hypothetical protein P4475_17835 [Halalkalibacterium halodurans]|uniref:hypothetical protein n=1 Tax=Halalkalibacterium halodurans TaxID=86665 RepID=UPI002E1B0D36|nr:hypothetical protein [Halalkalibacterium halodurans]